MKAIMSQGVKESAVWPVVIAQAAVRALELRTTSVHWSIIISSTPDALSTTGLCTPSADLCSAFCLDGLAAMVRVTGNGIGPELCVRPLLPPSAALLCFVLPPPGMIGSGSPRAAEPEVGARAALLASASGCTGTREAPLPTSE